MPVRVQRKRVRGWRMPENTVYVGRPTKWGNPSTSVLYYRKYVATEFTEKDLEPLRGKNLACWCKIGDDCHADILLELANQVNNKQP